MECMKIPRPRGEIDKLRDPIHRGVMIFFNQRQIGEWLRTPLFILIINRVTNAYWPSTALFKHMLSPKDTMPSPGRAIPLSCLKEGCKKVLLPFQNPGEKSIRPGDKPSPLLSNKRTIETFKTSKTKSTTTFGFIEIILTNPMNFPFITFLMPQEVREDGIDLFTKR